MNASNNITQKQDYLETWEISTEAWNTFIKTAKFLKKEDNIYMGIAFLILGIPFLMLARKTSFLIACLFVVPIAFLISWLRYKFATNYLKPKKNSVFVHFHPDYIIMNDKKIEVIGKNRWIKNMKIADSKNALKLLEIDVAWSTRKGNTFDELRIPIPIDKLEKAEMLLEFYSKYQNV